MKSAVVQDAEGALHLLTIDAEGPKGASVGSMRVAQSSAAVIEEAARLLGDSEASDWVRDAYRPGESLGTAFAKLFARVFSESGVILLDAADPELHTIATPIYAEAIRRAEELDSALLARGRQLHAAGYHEQVKVTESTALVFGTVQGARTPIQRVNADFLLGKERLSKQELLERIEADPEQFTPNVLLRPVVQDFLLPSIAYAGGPAEVAYFAQVGVVYEILLGRITPVLPRYSATVVDARAKRILQKYGMSLEDLFHGPDAVRERIAGASLPQELQDGFAQAQRHLEEALKGVVPPLTRLDPTLVGAAERAGNKIRYQFDRLRKRAANAELRREEIISRHASHLSSSLFPHKDLQERVITGVSFLARYGTAVLDTLQDAALSGCLDHQIIYLA